MAVALLLLWIFSALLPSTFAVTESQALLQLKKSFTNTEALDSWVPSSTPCTDNVHWVGLVCYNGIVTGLRLGGMGLSGEIDVSALLEIPGLRTLSLSNNYFSGSIPELNRLGALKALYLSGNQFSGEIPGDYFAKMRSLKKVWLSDNKFTGEIPSSFAQLSRLNELHLENNQFSGSIPEMKQSTLMSLDVSNNNLDGEIPSSLTKFSAKSFEGNAGLCGGNLGKDCNDAVKQSSPSPGANVAPSLTTESSGSKDHSKKIVAAIITLCVVVLTIITVFLIARRRKERDDKDFNTLGKENVHDHHAVQVLVSGSSRKETELSRKGKEMELSRKGSGSSRKGSSHGRGSNRGKGGGGGLGDLVAVNEENGVFGMSDLMKAAAEVLGNGGLGSSYKAVMTNGIAVVVKRMRETNAKAKNEFDAEIKRFGRLRHPNILTPLAYHYRKDEKLLIYEYVPRGSLLYLLHGDRGTSHAELNWPARLRIVQGIARGLGYLRTELASNDLPHGNLKSSNILLTENYQPLLSEYGLKPLINTASAAQALFAFKAPEAAQYGHVSPKCDVYCLGIIILEILTGKFPSQYLGSGKGGTDVVQWVASAIPEGRESELLDPEIASASNSLGEMQQLLRVGAACSESNPEKRLDMEEAIRRIEEVRVEGGQAAKTIQLLPSLRDGYADQLPASQTQLPSSHDEHGGSSGSFNNQSELRKGESFAFAIS